MISQTWEKIKSDVFLLIFCLLFGLAASGAYLAYQANPPHPEIIIENQAFLLDANSEKTFMASKAGEAYYPEGCKAGNTIKESNKIYFATDKEAEKAGFERSTRCK